MTALALMLALLFGDSYRTEVLFLGELPAERAIILYQRILGEVGESTIVLGRQPNVVVVKDTPERLRRFHELLAELDRKGAAASRIYLRPVQHVLPSALAALAREVVDDPAVRMIPDDRSRQLVVMCRPRTYLELDRLLRRLDVPEGGGGDRDIRVSPAPADPSPLLPNHPGESPP